MSLSASLFDDKVNVVSGGGAAGQGIGNGRSAAMLLSRGGAQVVVVDRREDAADRTVEMIRSEGGTAIACAVDVTTEQGCASVAEIASTTCGGLDILINNVGVGSRGNVLSTEPDTWDRVMRINVNSMYLMSRAVLPAMIDAGGGSIVNVSSISALLPRGLTAYSTSKGAVIALTKAMAVDHGTDGVRVNCVAPGPVLTPMVGGEEMEPKLRQGRIDASLLKIEGTGWDVGHAVAFLASDNARYITGETLVVDGGVTLSGPARTNT